ncbi:MAG: type II toxin-antitoxin system HigB family toxin [Gammaproteobacteria bacterium]|nr:type II toxin-antitoxin system HigB family toxin [Gammaproteobacteria bacterium]NVK87707.1 type II toxin-antitoxin system HigB family toxin [Gammaproteobacteria bacterium]
MKVVATHRLAEAKEKFPASRTALDGWFRIMNYTDFTSDIALRRTFSELRNNGNEYWFLVPGTTLLLKAIINFSAQVAMVKDVRPGVL